MSPDPIFRRACPTGATITITPYTSALWPHAFLATLAAPGYTDQIILETEAAARALAADWLTEQALSALPARDE